MKPFLALSLPTTVMNLVDAALGTRRYKTLIGSLGAQEAKSLFGLCVFVCFGGDMKHTPLQMTLSLLWMKSEDLANMRKAKMPKIEKGMARMSKIRICRGVTEGESPSRDERNRGGL